MRTKVFIQNLKCGGCANTIKAGLSQLTGIKEVVVSNDDDSVEFDHDNQEALFNASNLLSKLGYPVAGEANSLGKKAKSYVSCAVGRMKT